MKLIFRCDATAETGLGHLSRSLALAEAARAQGGTPLFCGHWSDPAFALLSASGFAHQGATAPTGSPADAAALAALVRAEQATGALADSYALDSKWLAQLAEHGVAVALLDDFARLDNYADCAGVLNFTVGAEKLNYPGLNPARRALGPGYFPVRKNLRRLREQGSFRRKAPARRVLVALGGGDRLGLTMPVCRALHRLQPGLQVRALLSDGPAQARAQGLSTDGFPPPAGDLAGHYAWADACVTGGGLVKYECAYLGLPMAIFSQTPEQQAETDQFCAVAVGWDLAPHGRTDAWEQRLEAFLRTPESHPRPRAEFPADSAERAMTALAGFLHPGVAPRSAVRLSA